MLIVNTPFRGYKKGQQIDDPAEVRMILESAYSTHVIRVADAPAADKPKTKAQPEKEK